MLFDGPSQEFFRTLSISTDLDEHLTEVPVVSIQVGVPSGAVCGCRHCHGNRFGAYLKSHQPHKSHTSRRFRVWIDHK